MINNNVRHGIKCHDEETIIAQCSPSGSGAIALLRLSGIDAVAIATRISTLASGKRLTTLPSHTIHYGWVIDQEKKHIDQVMFLLMRAPKTFTGQDVVEITAHNNPFIIDDIINVAISAGARLAQEGEFTKRAFLNNKIDLAQAEAINELIHAQTQMALKASLAQLEGSLSHKITSIEQDLLKALAFSEASFEFIDDENIEFSTQIAKIIKKTITTIDSLKNTASNQQRIRQGVRIAFIGSVNAGKSSLFNVLLDQERAIVTNIAGTTRDVIEAGMYKDGTYQTLVDTAGLRQSDNAIEKEGIRRSMLEAKKSDIVILVYDGSRELTSKEKKIYQKILDAYRNKIIIVHNKTDLTQKAGKTHNSAGTNKLAKKVIALSCKNKKNIDQLKKEMKQKIDSLFTDIESPFLLNKRQYNVLMALKKQLTITESMLTGNVAYELVSLHLKDMLTHLSEFSGKTISERGLDTIFKQFCIGK